MGACGRAECENYEAKYDFYSCFTNACEAVSEFTRPYSNCVAANSGQIQADCEDATTQFQTLCAVRPVADGGCMEAFGTDGSNGTCAMGSDTTDAAVAICTEPIRQAAITEVCMALPNSVGGCAEQCAVDPEAVACTNCLGTVDFDQANFACQNLHSLGCMGEEIPQLAEACVTECFTACITKDVGSCVVDNLHAGPCVAEVASLATATCD